MSDLPVFEYPEWMADAACRGMDPALFFPERGEDVRPAKAVCNVCPCRQECLDHAMANGERFGVFGGLSERERRRPRKTRKIARVRADKAVCGTDGGYSKHRRAGEVACTDCLHAHAEAGKVAKARQKARRRHLTVVAS